MPGAGSYPGAAARAADAGSAFTVDDLLRVVDARRGLILRTALVVMVATALFLLTLPTLYWTSATVTLDTRKNNIADQSAVLSALPTDPASLQNQLQILGSRDLAAEVIGKLQLYDDPEFNARLHPSIFAAFDPRSWIGDSAPDLARERDDVISSFLGHLSVDPLGLSTSIQVGFASKDPDKAARIANTIVDTYVQDQLYAKRDETDRTAAWLTVRIKELSDQAQAASDAAQNFKTEHNLAEAADGTPLIDQQITALNTQLIAARADLSQKESAYNHVSAFGDGSDTAQLSQVVSSPLIVQLRSQEATILEDEAQMAGRYGPRHPKMIAMEAQRHDLQTKIEAEVNRITGSMGSDVAVARGQVSSLGAGLAAAQRLAASQNAAWVKLKSLEANATSARATYESFLTRLHETQGQDAIQSADARIISHAAAPNAPSSPHRMMIFAASIPAGLLIGLLLALIAERFSVPARPAQRRNGVARVPAMAAVPVVAAPPPRPAPVVAPPPVLAEIPNASDARAADYVIDWPKSAFAMTVTTLIGRLLGGKSGRVIAVTAADGRDGKTSIAIGFARAAAAGGKKVVILEGDLKRPVTAVAMGLAPAQCGIVEVLERRAPLSRALLMDPRSNAFILSCTKPVKEPALVWGSPQFAELIAHLKKSCDLIVIDSALASTGDAQLIARAADAVVMVVARNRAHQPGIANAVYAMASQPTPVGIALAG